LSAIVLPHKLLFPQAGLPQGNVDTATRALLRGWLLDLEKELQRQQVS